MNQSAIKEIIQKLQETLSSLGTTPIKDDEEYKYYIDIHEMLRKAASVVSEIDQIAIDKMDGYDAQKFKEALGL